MNNWYTKLSAELICRILDLNARAEHITIRFLLSNTSIRSRDFFNRIKYMTIKQLYSSISI